MLSAGGGVEDSNEFSDRRFPKSKVIDGATVSTPHRSRLTTGLETELETGLRNVNSKGQRLENTRNSRMTR